MKNNILKPIIMYKISNDRKNKSSYNVDKNPTMTKSKFIDHNLMKFQGVNEYMQNANQMS